MASLYFTIIGLSTVGFGDITPGFFSLKKGLCLLRRPSVLALQSLWTRLRISASMDVCMWCVVYGACVCEREK